MSNIRTGSGKEACESDQTLWPNHRHPDQTFFFQRLKDMLVRRPHGNNRREGSLSAPGKNINQDVRPYALVRAPASRVAHNIGSPLFKTGLFQLRKTAFTKWLGQVQSERTLVVSDGKILHGGEKPITLMTRSPPLRLLHNNP